MFTLILMEYENSLPDARDELTMAQALSIAKRQTKRLGLQDCKMQYHINENDQFYSVIVHTGEIK